MKTNPVKNAKRLAFVVHHDRKTELIEWSYFNREILQQHDIIATGEAAKILQGTLNKPVIKYLNGPYEGYQELCSMIVEGKIDAVILFWSTEETPLQKNGIRGLIHTALEADIIIANNKTTADFIITSPLMYNRADEARPQKETGINTEHVKKNNAA
ncbi:MAG TPA: methylglyoxal synthase [Chitinophagaceae bacterium]|nr:methylglyoxal synthase [Chitinophagaceae bacterium]